MKTHSLLFLLLALPVPAAATLPREIHLGFSPFLPDAGRAAVSRQLPAFVLDPTVLPGGTHVVFWNAWEGATLAELTIPMLPFDSPAARAVTLTRPLAAVTQWLRTAAAPPAGVAIGSGAVRAPEWLHAASSTASARPRTFVLLGDPRYPSPEEPAFDMVAEPLYPADGHLALGLGLSVFGLAEKRDRLANAAVHWCFFPSAPWQTEKHRFQVTRFWSLFVAGQGGILRSFQSDLPYTLRQVVANDPQPAMVATLDPADDKPVMHRATRSLPAPVIWTPPLPIVEPDPAPAPAPIPESPLVVAPPGPTLQEESPAPELVPAIVEGPPSPAPEPVPAPQPAPVPIPIAVSDTAVGIGIAWAQPIDLDLYVIPFPGAKEIHFRRMRTAEARLYRDERNATAGRFFEFVELTGANADLSSATIYVNYYAGRASDVIGEVVLFDRGHVRVGAFALSAAAGNRGADADRRDRSPHWLKIDSSSLQPPTSALAANRPVRR